jgi:hypothetical protein
VTADDKRQLWHGPDRSFSHHRHRRHRFGLRQHEPAVRVQLEGTSYARLLLAIPDARQRPGLAACFDLSQARNEGRLIRSVRPCAPSVALPLPARALRHETTFYRNLMRTPRLAAIWVQPRASPTQLDFGSAYAPVVPITKKSHTVRAPAGAGGSPRFQRCNHHHALGGACESDVEVTLRSVCRQALRTASEIGIYCRGRNRRR